MLLFIDETGDSGFKIGKGSSKYFIIAGIIFDDHLDAEETALKIKRFRREEGFPDTVEFKFNKSRKKLRSGFLENIKNMNFSVRVLVVDKITIYSPELINNKNSFYNYFVKEFIKNNSSRIINAHIKLDGSGDKEFKKEFKAYITKTLDSNTIKKFKFIDSKKDNLIQLADMIVGAIAKKFKNEGNDSDVYYEIIKNKIEDMWEFGKQK